MTTRNIDGDAVRRRVAAGESVAAVARDLKVPRTTLYAHVDPPSVSTPRGTTGGELPSVSLTGDEGTAVSRVYDEATAETLTPDDMLRGWKLDPSVWEIVDGTVGVNRWMVSGRDADGEFVEHWNYQYKAKVRKRSNVADAELRRAAPITVVVKTPSRLPARRTTDLKTAVVYEDAQVAYWQDPDDGTWHTAHDEAALDVALQITQDLEAETGIDEVVDVGDLLDLPNFSKHRSAPSFMSSAALNKSIDRAARLLAERAAATPHARRRWLTGNHEQRLTNWLIDYAPQLLGVRRAGQKAPMLSLGYLLGIDEIGWELVPDPYPTGAVWLNHNTRVIHGTKAGSRTAASYLSDEVNTVFGHTPRVQMEHRSVSRVDADGAPAVRTYVSAGGGGFMRIDGRIPPGAFSGVDERGVPGRGAAPWQQGFWVVTFDPEGRMVPRAEPVMITAGRADFRGRVYRARCDADGNSLDLAAG
jgi:hypothetical protein